MPILDLGKYQVIKHEKVGWIVNVHGGTMFGYKSELDAIEWCLREMWDEYNRMVQQGVWGKEAERKRVERQLSEMRAQGLSFQLEI